MSFNLCKTCYDKRQGEKKCKECKVAPVHHAKSRCVAVEWKQDCVEGVVHRTGVRTVV